MNRCEECGKLVSKPRLESPGGRLVCEACFQEISSGLGGPKPGPHSFNPAPDGVCLVCRRLRQDETVHLVMKSPATKFDAKVQVFPAPPAPQPRNAHPAVEFDPTITFRAEVLPCYPTQGPDGKSCLALAKEAVDDRAGRYGNPLDNHTHTAALWSAFLRARGWTNCNEKDMTAEDVCWLNVLQKASRDAFSPYLDNLTDGCGYLRNVEVIRAMRTEREKKE